MKRIIIFSALLIAVISCTKGKFQSKPSIKFNSFNTQIVSPNNTLVATLDFTDKEGDLDSVFIVRQRLNRRNPVTVGASPYSIPEFGNRNQGQIVVNLAYATDLTFNLIPIGIPGSGGRNEPDTLILKFVVKDKAANISDTVNSNQVIVIR